MYSPTARLPCIQKASDRSQKSKIESLLYSPYYAKARNEWRDPSPRNTATKKHRSISDTGPGIEPQSSCTDCDVTVLREMPPTFELISAMSRHPRSPRSLHAAFKPATTPGPGTVWAFTRSAHSAVRNVPPTRQASQMYWQARYE